MGTLDGVFGLMIGEGKFIFAVDAGDIPVLGVLGGGEFESADLELVLGDTGGLSLLQEMKLCQKAPWALSEWHSRTVFWQELMEGVCRWQEESRTDFAEREDTLLAPRLPQRPRNGHSKLARVGVPERAQL